MDTSCKGRQKFALLVGIDAYLNDHPRVAKNGSKTYLRSLRGCVNDVTELGGFLSTSYLHFTKIVKLTSPGDSPGTWAQAKLSATSPTFKNIKRQFQDAQSTLNGGDFFFFHFSGHGALLSSTRPPPLNVGLEPSLLPVDFNCHEAAVAGWQLNNWLEDLHKKGVRVVVSLDSCYSGEAWRNSVDMNNLDRSHARTPETWPQLPILDVDLAAVEDETDSSDYRDAVAGESWSINPKAFTVMTACQKDELASERIVHERYFGAFTHALIEDLEQQALSKQHSTYLAMQQRIEMATRTRSQKPFFFGRIRLLFLGDVEPTALCPIMGRWLDGRRISLPNGTLHGVCRGSEFSTTENGEYTAVFRVTDVDKFSCIATVLNEPPRNRSQTHLRVLPSRWSFGDRKLIIMADPSISTLGVSREPLVNHLKGRISSDLQVVNSEIDTPANGTAIRLSLADGHIHIRGASPWLHHRTPVPDTAVNLAQDAATKVSHLARYVQLLDLKNLPTAAPKPFTINWALGAVEEDGEVRICHKFELKNTKETELVATLINFGPGFNVKEIGSWTAEPNGNVTDAIKITVPDDLKAVSPAGTEHRDILRMIVTRGERVSWSGLELPHIWHASQGLMRPEDGYQDGRDATSVRSKPEFSWWIHDYEVLSPGY